MKRGLVIIFSLTIIFTSCRLGLAESSASSLDSIQHTKYAVQIDLQGKQFFVEFARSELEKKRGLMYRKSLLQNQGMLFYYKRPKHFSFWMKNTPVIIDIAFFDEDNKLVEIKTMQAFSEEVHSSKGKGYYALEMRSGWFDEHKILLGSELKILKKVFLRTLSKEKFSSLP